MECRSNPCHVNATCSELTGGFSCVCKTGFTGDGINCKGTVRVFKFDFICEFELKFLFSHMYENFQIYYLAVNFSPRIIFFITKTLAYKLNTTNLG